MALKTKWGERGQGRIGACFVLSIMVVVHSVFPRRLHLFACLRQGTRWENLSGEINTCQKLYRISQGEEECESAYLTKREEKGIFRALWEN